MTGRTTFSRAREAAVLLVGPLHRRARALALGQAQVVADADLVAVLHHRRAGQREQQAEGELQPPAIVAEHRRQPAPDAAVVELHPLLRAERVEHLLPLLVGQPSEIELVVAAQELHPLRVARTLARVLERPDQRIEVAGRQRVEQPLVDREVEHHLQPVAFVAEVVEALVGRHVRFGQHDRRRRSATAGSRASPSAG